MTLDITLEEALRVLHENDFLARRNARELLLQHIDVVFTQVAALVEEGSHPAGSEAVSLLGACNVQERVPIILKAIMNKENPIMAQSAARAIANARPFPQAELIAAFAATPAIAKPILLRTLSQNGNSTAVPSLLAWLQTTDDPTLRYALIDALGQLGDCSICDVLRPYLNDDNHHVREYTARALARL